MSVHAQRIKEVRMSRGYTQLDIALELGMNRTSYVQMENGKRGIGALELAKLAEFYGLSYEFMFHGTPPESPY